MKKTFLIIFLLATSLACTVTFPDDSFDKKASTQVALALTSTALDEEINQKAAESATAEPEEQTAATATETLPPPDDPKEDLGQPTWSDDLSSGQYWSLDSGDITYETTTFSLDNGKLSVRSDAIGKGNIWHLNYLTFKDAYLESEFEVEDCSGDDQYGLVFRAAEYDDGISYYFHVTCNGKYDLRRWTAEGSDMLLGMPSNDRINSGSNQTNILGVWVKGSTIRLYVNGYFLEEIDDSSIKNDGHFGLFINARQTPGFTIHIDNISYWTLN